MEAYRATKPELAGVPMTYAGRLDPMASGSLLVLLGETCKRQQEYHGLDKAYEVTALIGVSSDSGDVLGIITEHEQKPVHTNWNDHAQSLIGEIKFPYPAYSAKTVAGIPLHTWAVTGRLHEIELPERTSTIYELAISGEEIKDRLTIYEYAINKIALLPRSTDERKALGNDFRRPEVYAAWEQFRNTGEHDDQFTVVHFSCVCSSGTYMRTLADILAQKAGSRGLAISINRTEIGHYHEGAWAQRYTSSVIN
jgi:tRNA pseudouridine(55) synthase